VKDVNVVYAEAKAVCERKITPHYGAYLAWYFAMAIPTGHRAKTDCLKFCNEETSKGGKLTLKKPKPAVQYGCTSVTI
jgi:hypothetical protein